MSPEIKSDREKISERVILVRRPSGRYAAIIKNAKGNETKISLRTKDRREAMREALRLDERLLAGADVSKEKPLSLQGAYDLYRAACVAKNLAGGSLDKYDSVFAPFIAYAAAKGVTTVQKVTIELVEAYLTYRRTTDKLADVTITMHACTVKQLTKWLRKRERIRVDPLANFDVPRCRRPKHPATSASQVRAIVAAATGEMRDLMITLAMTGMRVGEGVQLQIRDFDIETMTIMVRPKSGASIKTASSERRTPIHPDLLATLQPRLLGKTDDLLFQRIDKSGAVRSFREDRVNLAFKRAATKLGYEVGRAKRGLTLNSLRRFFITHCLFNRIPQGYVDRWVGHKEQSLNEHYLGDSHEDSRSLIASVNFGIVAHKTSTQDQK